MQPFFGITLLLLMAGLIWSSSNTDSLTMYMRKVLQPSKDDTKPTNATSKLALLHCNVYCNGTTREQIVNRGCWTATPECKPCRCDDLCQEYGDCCPDKEGKIDIGRTTKYDCVVAKEDQYNIYGYFMVTKCPDGLAIGVSGSSADIIAPVTSVITNTTYMNSGIALCNNDTNCKSWKKFENCIDMSHSQNFEHMSTDCKFDIDPPLGVSVRSCSPKFSTRILIDRCNVTSLLKTNRVDLEVQLKCIEGPHYPVAAGDYVFKNIYCFLCNGLQPSSNGCSHVIETFGTSMDILVDLNRRPLCGSQEWFDKLKGVCRYLFCRSGYELKGSTCVSKDVKLTDVEFNFNRNFWPVNPGQPSPGSRKDVESLVIQNLPDIMARIDVFDFLFTIKFMDYIDVYSDSFTHEIPVFGLYIELRTNRTCCRGDFEEMISDALNDIWILKGNNTILEFTPRDDEVSNLFITESQVYQVVSPSSVAERIEAYSSLSETLGAAGLYLSVPITEPDCAFLYLSVADFKWSSNKSIVLQYADIIIPSENITRINDRKVIVCKSFLEEFYKDYQIPMKVKDIVSVFFSTLSLICLALTAFTFCMIPSLLTLPAKNTMCLVVALFIAQLLLMFEDVARVNEVACKIIAVLIHYFWLCVIFWMNVCSFHMFNVFVIDAAKPITLQRNHKRLLQYIIYANGTPAVIVLATITASLIVSSGSQIGYGDDACYLSSALLTGVSFVLPLGIVLVLNVIFFGMSVWTMAKISKMSDTIGKDRNQVLIYIKLSTLTGVFWIFSLLAEFLNIDVFIFISIILNASQGVFIFISYVANKRVLGKWKSKFGISSEKETIKDNISTRL